MNYTFDYFVGNLKCPKCGVVSNADETTNIQTKMRLHPAMAPLGIGDFVEIDTHNFEESGYLCIKKPHDLTTFSVVEAWECPSCGEPFNWVLIEVVNGIIQALKCVNLNESLSNKANYISDECEYCDWVVKEGNLLHCPTSV